MRAQTAQKGAALPHATPPLCIYSKSLKVDYNDLGPFVQAMGFNRVELVARGVFTSVTDLGRKIIRYIREYTKTARTFRWKYSDVTRRIKPC